MLGGEIAHDDIRLPKHHPIIVDGRNAGIGVELTEPGIGNEAEIHAGIDALGLQRQLFDDPHDLLNVDRVSAAPNFQHATPRRPCDKPLS